MILKVDKEIRLDKFLSEKLNTSRNQIENLIKKELVLINQKKAKKGGIKLKKDDTIEILKPIKEEKEIKKVDFEVPILYEDEDLLVVNKPPFIVVHPAPSVKENFAVTVGRKLPSYGTILSPSFNNGDEFC